MRSWWRTLGVLTATAGGLLFAQSAAHAQFPPPSGYGGQPGGMTGMPANAGMMGAPGMTGAPAGGAPGGEKTNPFEMKDDGMPNAFTDLNDPRPHVDAPYCLTFRGEYVGWHVTSGPISIPLVTTSSSISGTSFGQLGSPNTSILVNSGNSVVDYGLTSGFRLTAGLAIGYLPPIEVSGFYMKQTATIFSGGSLSNPTQLLTIPFQDVEPGALIPGAKGAGTEFVYPVSVPVGSPLGSQGGTIAITSQLTYWGAEVNFLVPLNDSDYLHLNFIGGYRHMQLNETLAIATQEGTTGAVVAFNGNPLPTAQFSTSTLDTFATTNVFDGGQFGLRTQLDMGRWSLFSDVKLGLGETAQTLSIGGNSSLNQNVAGRSSQGSSGGVLALPSNSGTFTTNHFGIVPEFNIALSFQLNHCIRFFAGYDFLLWNSVARPGDALNNVIDARQIPTSALSAASSTNNGPGPPSFVSRTFIAQGFFAGIEFGF